MKEPKQQWSRERVCPVPRTTVLKGSERLAMTSLSRIEDIDRAHDREQVSAGAAAAKDSGPTVAVVSGC